MKKIPLIFAVLAVLTACDNTQSRNQENIRLVFQRRVDMCMCGSEILRNYTQYLERKGVNMLKCCEQMARICINNQTIEDINEAADLIRRDLYSKHLGYANCSQGQEKEWNGCTFAPDFCIKNR